MDPDLDLKQLDVAAGDYSNRGGLRLIPIALFALLMSAFASGLVELPMDWVIILSGLGLQWAVFGHWLIAYWYRRNGGMTRHAWPSSNAELVRWLVPWVAMSLLVLAAIDSPGAGMHATGYIGIAAIGCMLVYRVLKGEMWPQSHALMSLGLIGVILSLSPIATSEGHGPSGLLLACVGVALLVASAVDHKQLDRWMDKLSEEEDEDG